MKKIILIIICLITFNSTIAFSMEEDIKKYCKISIFNIVTMQISYIFTETFKELYKRIAIYNINMGEKMVKNIYSFTKTQLLENNNPLSHMQIDVTGTYKVIGTYKNNSLINLENNLENKKFPNKKF